MSEAKQLPKRQEALSEELSEVDKIKGTLAQGATEFLTAIEYVLDIYRKAEVIYVYAHLKNDEDTANTTNQALYARASSLIAQVSEAVSWFEPEMLELSDQEIWAFFEKESKLELYRHFVEQIISERAHILPAVSWC